MKQNYRYAIAASLATVLCIAALIIRGAFPQEPVYADPFEPYEHLMPGEPFKELEGYSCAPMQEYDMALRTSVYCYFQPIDGPIISITVLTESDVIISVWYRLHGLRMGDITRRWGRPQNIWTDKNFYTARWEQGVSASAPLKGWYTLQAPVRFVTVSRPF
jgi:hypothetical protein